MANSQSDSYGMTALSPASPPHIDTSVAQTNDSRQQSAIAMHHNQPNLDSPVLTPVPSFDGTRESEKPKLAPFVSPFYEHPPASHEKVTQVTHHFYNKDLESGDITPLSVTPSGGHDVNPFTSQISVNAHQECRMMWPSRQTQMANRADTKRKRRANRTCAPLRDRWVVLSFRQRLTVKVLTALMVVGIAVAIGVGISLAVNGGVYSSSGNSREITPHHA